MPPSALESKPGFLSFFFVTFFPSPPAHLQSQSPSEELFDSQDAPQASVAFPHSQVPPHNSWTVPGDSPAIHPYVGTLRAPDPKVETTNPDYSHILSCIMFVSLED